MPVSEKQKGYAAKWDKENMRTLSARVRKDEYELFKEYCESIGSTPSMEIKKFVRDKIKSFENRDDTDD